MNSNPCVLARDAPPTLLAAQEVDKRSDEHHLGLGRQFRIELADRAAIQQHRDAIRERENFVQTVRDPKYRPAARAKTADGIVGQERFGGTP